jgi:hypothetical protein
LNSANDSHHSSRDYNEEEPWIISFKTQGVEMEKLSFSKQYDARAGERPEKPFRCVLLE